MKIKLESNGSVHDCKICIHKEYCGHDKDILLRDAKPKWLVGIPDKRFVFVPNNCPILTNPYGKPEKVIFT